MSYLVKKVTSKEIVAYYYDEYGRKGTIFVPCGFTEKDVMPNDKICFSRRSNKYLKNLPFPGGAVKMKVIKKNFNSFTVAKTLRSGHIYNEEIPFEKFGDKVKVGDYLEMRFDGWLYTDYAETFFADKKNWG